MKSMIKSKNKSGIQVANPPFEFTTTEAAAPDKLAYANKIGSGSINKYNVDKIRKESSNRVVGGDEILVSGADRATKSSLSHSAKVKGRAGITIKSGFTKASKQSVKSSAVKPGKKHSD